MWYGGKLAILVHMKLHVPSDDAASPPHQSDGTIVEGPAELFGCLTQQHEALCVGNDLGGVEGLQRNKNKESMVAGIVTQFENSHCSKNIYIPLIKLLITLINK